jgi:hypothetical protein
MTIEQLLGKSAEELAAMSDLEVETFFAPYLKHIRPEFKPKKTEQTALLPGGEDKPKPKKDYKQKDMEARLAAAMKKMGITP